MKIITSLLLGFLLISNSVAADKKQTVADHLQSISVTIRAEVDWAAAEGSGVIFTRKDAKGNFVNYVWTAGHVVDILRTERKVVINGSVKTLVEFKDALVIKEIRQNGRIVGRLQMDAEVLKYSESEDGHDLALLRIRKLNFVHDSVVFYLDKEIPSLGTDLLHVGSLLGQFGANSMTSGIMSQHGRILKDLNKLIFDQTTCTAFPGSSGGGVFLKHDGETRCIGLLVRGAGEGFNLIVPTRRMVDYCREHNIMWALDANVKMPNKEEVDKLDIEFSLAEKEESTVSKEKTQKSFPFMIRKYKVIPDQVIRGDNILTRIKRD